MARRGLVAVDLDSVKAQKMMLGVAHLAQDHPLEHHYSGGGGRGEQYPGRQAGRGEIRLLLPGVLFPPSSLKNYTNKEIHIIKTARQ